MARKNDIWNRFCRHVMERAETSDHPKAPLTTILEPGVRFFIAMIERLGGRSLYSCEGHPTGFYIAAYIPQTVVVRMAECTPIFDIEVLAVRDYYRLSLKTQEDCDAWNGSEKERLLILAAKAWVKEFGKIAPDDVPEKLSLSHRFVPNENERALLVLRHDKRSRNTMRRIQRQRKRR